MSSLSSPAVGESYWVSHVVLASQSGMRLDAFLKQRYRRRSRSKLQQVIADGRIFLKRALGAHLTPGRIKSSFVVLEGDEILIQTERKPEPEVDFNYRILYEDEFLFIVDKPAHLPVHPAGSYYFNTLLTHLKTGGHRKPLREDQDYYLPHRIDKETSGILVIAKTVEVCAHIVAQFAERKTEKYYLAVVHGEPPEEFEVDWPMRKDLHSRVRLKMEAVPPGSPLSAKTKPDLSWLKTPGSGDADEADENESGGEGDGLLTAFTRFKKIRTFRRQGKIFSEVACYPKTGRQHQIRVHLAAYGHPIVGDKLYSVTEAQAVQIFDFRNITPEIQDALILSRHALHAAGLKFTHPITQQLMQFESQPDDNRWFHE